MTKTIIGFYGKIPSHGDFIHVNLPRAFINSWDPGLQEIISHWRNQLPEDWVADYLTIAPYRFVLSKGIAGEVNWLGVLVPSRDRTGRLFPFTICIPLPSDISPLDIQKNHGSWLDEVEDLAISCLHPDFNAEHIHTTFMEELIQIGLPDITSYTIQSHIDPSVLLHNVSCAAEDTTPTSQKQFSFAQSNSENGLQSLTKSLLDEFCYAYSLWWSKDTPSILYSQGLPEKSISPALIDQQWSKWGWHVGQSSPENSPTATNEDDTQTFPIFTR
jgi:type VI secretion system protein ImpM